jgi:DNA-binding NarL/FixJ family response regulator
VAGVSVGLFVVDDHPVVLAGLSAVVDHRDDIVIVGSAGSISTARAAISDPRIDVLLLDLRLPDGSGIELLPDAERLLKPPAVVILSSFDSPQYVKAALALGARGFVLKTAPLDQVLDAVVVAAAGGLAYSAAQIGDSWTAAWRALTGREYDIISGVMAGDSNDEIGRHLCLARKTVEAYLARLFIRFNVNSRTELGILAEHEHLMDLPVKSAKRLSPELIARRDRGAAAQA